MILNAEPFPNSCIHALFPPSEALNLAEYFSCFCCSCRMKMFSQIGWVVWAQAVRRTGLRARCAADGSKGYVARCGGLSTCAKPSNATEFVAEYLSSRKSQSLFATVCKSTRFVLPPGPLPTPPPPPISRPPSPPPASHGHRYRHDAQVLSLHPNGPNKTSVWCNLSP